jgi:hypothetical protein
MDYITDAIPVIGITPRIKGLFLPKFVQCGLTNIFRATVNSSAANCVCSVAAKCRLFEPVYRREASLTDRQ